MGNLRRGLLLLAAVAGALVAALPAYAGGHARVEVVVELDAPPLARAVSDSRVLTSAVRRARLSLSTPTSAAYLSSLASEQRAVEARIRRAVPSARIRWRYQVVLDALAVVVPENAIGRLERIPGVRRVSTSVGYHLSLDHSPQAINAPALWGPTFSTVGQGMRIGIIDEGVDQTHPFFSPAGFTMPPGFPKGNTAYTSAKVIVARSFSAPGIRGERALPFDPKYSYHGTHVAGIAAGDRGTLASGRPLSGVAPGAYIGNYKVYSVVASSYDGLNGNSPEIVRGIEAAVRDGMNVINLSLGEVEVAPDRDLVVRAINAAADAGVVPTISAGNTFDTFGRGSVWSPGTAAKAITVAAASDDSVIAGFSSSGPTPVSLRLKPDVTAPGVSILSSVPRGKGLWASFDGTSMAAPHVAGAAALLKQRHPSWTVAQIKSALVLTGRPVTRANAEVPTTREGGGMIDLEAADRPLVFAAPTSLSFGLVRPGSSATQQVALTDAGGGSGAWSVEVGQQPGDGQVQFTVPPSISVPGDLQVRVTAGPREGEATGFVVLTKGGERRRIPYWLRVASPALAREPHRTLTRPGTYAGNTRGKAARVDTYRYPDRPAVGSVSTILAGPEQVFRVALTTRRRVANFGVRLLSRGPGVEVEPRIVRAGDENRLATETALPLIVDPYVSGYYRPVPAAGVVLPERTAYDIVFDSPTRAGAGSFRFLFWVNDTTPPSVRILARVIRGGRPLTLAVRDRGAGVWPESLTARIDGRLAKVAYAGGRARLSTSSLRRGRHTLVFTASDYQETKNHENVARVLPNTRTVRATFSVR